MFYSDSDSLCPESTFPITFKYIFFNSVTQGNVLFNIQVKHLCGGKHMLNSFILTRYIGLYVYRLCIQKVQTDAQEGKEDVNIYKNIYKMFVFVLL